MSAVGEYHIAGMRLAQAVEVYWDELVDGGPGAITSAILTIEPFLDRYRDACSALDRGGQDVEAPIPT